MNERKELTYDELLQVTGGHPDVFVKLKVKCLIKYKVEEIEHTITIELNVQMFINGEAIQYIIDEAKNWCYKQQYKFISCLPLSVERVDD